MTKSPDLFDVVALAQDLPAEGLVRGQVGTIVEVHAGDQLEVEFSDGEGKTYGLLALPKEQLIVLHHAPVKSAS